MIPDETTLRALAREVKDALGLARADCDCPECEEYHRPIEAALLKVAALQREQDAQIAESMQGKIYFEIADAIRQATAKQGERV